MSEGLTTIFDPLIWLLDTTPILDVDSLGNPLVAARRLGDRGCSLRGLAVRAFAADVGSEWRGWANPESIRKLQEEPR